MQTKIGHIYKLRNGNFEGVALDTSPCRCFGNPHAAENYIREECGIHPVVKTEYWPMKRLDGSFYPLGAIGVWADA